MSIKNLFTNNFKNNQNLNIQGLTTSSEQQTKILTINDSNNNFIANVTLLFNIFSNTYQGTFDFSNINNINLLANTNYLESVETLFDNLKFTQNREIHLSYIKVVNNNNAYGQLILLNNKIRLYRGHGRADFLSSDPLTINLKYNFVINNN